MIRHAITAAALVLLGATAAVAEEAGWSADAKGCKVWNSTPKPGETVAWSGPCSNGYADGTGILFWSLNGEPEEFYYGELHGGHYEGFGMQIWPQGNRYEGNYRADRAHGQGTYRTPDGQTISGVWSNGCLRASGRIWRVGAGENDCH